MSSLIPKIYDRLKTQLLRVNDVDRARIGLYDSNLLNRQPPTDPLLNLRFHNPLGIGVE